LTLRGSFRLPPKGVSMKPTAPYPTPPFKQVGHFFSLREAGFQGKKAYLA